MRTTNWRFVDSNTDDFQGSATHANGEQRYLVFQVGVGHPYYVTTKKINEQYH
jgi:hypothetical protein